MHPLVTNHPTKTMVGLLKALKRVAIFQKWFKIIPEETKLFPGYTSGPGKVARKLTWCLVHLSL